MRFIAALGFPHSIRQMSLGILLMLLPNFAIWAQEDDISSIHTPAMMLPLDDANHKVVYDAQKQKYIVYNRVGNVIVGQPRIMSEQEYREFRREEAVRSYWTNKRKEQGGQTAGGGILPQLRVGGETFDRIFGSNVIEIIPQGSAELLFGITNSKTENFTIPEDMRSNTTFDFDAKLKVNLTGRVGDKLRLDLKWDTEATFDFEQNVKIEYTGTEDEIIQKIEAGNVTMPLPGTLITGSQSLFGFKTDLKFGNLYVSTVLSQRKGQSQTIEVKGGAQAREFEVRADAYEANKHFFLSKYFYDTYDKSLSTLPLITSGAEITKIEVWVTNKQGRFDDSRDLVAFVDLGEREQNIFAKKVITGNANQIPDNSSNTLYHDLTKGAYAGIRDLVNVTPLLAPLTVQNFRNGQDYEKLENARLLKPTEYTLNRTLGYISLNISLNSDEVLAVAYEYTLHGRTYKVGELSNDGIDAPQALIVKLLKGTDLSPAMPTWRLMMKNIYSLGAYQISNSDFILDILYQDDEIGTPVNYLTEGAVRNTPLLSVLNLDNLDGQGNAGPDGIFDFVEGVTMLASSGRLIFPAVEPFGAYLANKIGDHQVAERIAYPELYDSTLSRAQQIAEKNKFFIKGEYRGSNSSEISLNAPNVPKGSVVVTAGGKRLVENTDYVVDYLLGTVKIINQGLLESGTPIRISLESNLGIDFQVKTLVGTHLDYRFSDKFNIGATVLNLAERPMTKKVNYGNEAMSNTIWGVNTSYETELPWLTHAIDFLPLLETKEKSTFTFEGEMAHFIPGQSRHLDKRASVYLDDFEANKSTIDLRMWSAWSLASTPQGQPALFPEGDLINDLRYGMQRARFAWYTIDPLFLRNSSLTPQHIRNDPESQSSHFVREIEEQELFPNRNIPQGQPTTIPILNLAFYPEERGPYNYDATNINPDGTLRKPEKRWGGIMRALPITDFESSNIEYIEFWLMDPFVEENDSPGGELYFNLGNVSEDILRDGRKFFENGLPVGADQTQVDTTVWGRVPKMQSSVMAFDNDPTARALQDVGLDGLPSTDEQSFFADFIADLAANVGTGSQAVADAQRDPSSDDYRYFRSSIYDEQGASILERYKLFNNTEGNSPTAEQSPESYPTSATTLPDAEDLNRDNTQSDNESYYQYRVSIRPADLEVGRNYVTDKVTARSKFANGVESQVDWYQFKVPVKEFEERIGHIQDFKSIRFIRLFVRGFDRPVIMRFASLGLVRGEWRRYERSLLDAQEVTGSGSGEATYFDVSAVNIEENNTRTPVNYVLPPNVTREIDASQAIENELNEQAMELKVVGLQDGDARAAFRNVNYDLRQYKQLAMDIHAEAIPGEALNDGELTVFLRIGSDYMHNYYEYEVPLSLTPPGFYSNNRDEDRAAVWPHANRIDIDMTILRDAKLERDAASRSAGGRISPRTPFRTKHDDRTITVVGYPNLGSVRVLMIGVRNPKKTSPQDDGYAKSGVVWVNELRLSRIADHGGWAALATMTTRLADLGVVTLSGRVETPGFGALESKVNERAKETTYQYDANGNFELGKFFPARWEVSIPMFIGFAETYATPEYNPLDPDVPFSEALKHLPDARTRDSLRKIALDFTRRKSLNFTNVRVNHMGKEPRMWDPANFALSYSYSEQNARNVKAEYRNQIAHRGSFTYGYNARPKSIEPFRKVSWLSSPYLALIRDFNFAPYPRQLSFRTEVNRNYMEQQLRNINSPMLRMNPTYAKAFEWNRSYGLSWDLTRALRFDYSATNLAIIDEPQGMVNKRLDRELYNQWSDSVWRSVRRFGTTTQYNHKITASYSIPFSKIPFLTWLSGNASYNADYQWDAAPRLVEDVKINIGNTVQNSSRIDLNAQVSLTNLYSKVSYLNEVNQKFERLANGQPISQKQEFKTVTFERDRFSIAPGRSRTITHNLGLEEVKVRLYGPNGEEIPCDVEVRSKTKVRITTADGVTRGRVVVEGQKPKSQFTFQLLGEALLRGAMGLRNISASWSQNAGTFVPGYLPNTMLFGLSDLGKNPAPGLPFVIGVQDEDFAWKAIRNDWLTGDSTVNNAFKLTHSTTYNYRITFEPFPYARLDITGMRTFAKNRSEFYRKQPDGLFHAMNPQIQGNFTISTILIKTAFQRSDRKNAYISEAFEEFAKNRPIIAQKLAEERRAGGRYTAPNNSQHTGYPDGYGPLAPEVLIHSLYAAYTGEKPNNHSLNPFPQIPLPNWQFTYDGLSRIVGIRDVLRQLSLRHGYRSNYTIGSYVSNEQYTPEEDGFSYVRNLQEDFISQYQMDNVTLSEQFSPLVGVDIGFINTLTTKFEVRKNRSMSMSLANNQLTDMDSWEYIIGGGYRFEDLPLILKTNLGGRKVLRSQLQLQADFGIRNTSTILRKLAEGTNIPTAGQWSYTLKLSADYMISEQISVRVFFDRMVNKPLVSLSFPTSNTSFGFSVRFTLEQ